jgi:predicted O-methyltransferase YrrM
MRSGLISLVKPWVPAPARHLYHSLSRALRVLRGDVFANPGPISDRDFEEMRAGIDEVKPRVFIELGTGSGVSAARLYEYLTAHYPDCHFYTMEIFRDRYEAVRQRLKGDTFHAVLGLSVLPGETTPPASVELENYRGPADVLRRLFDSELRDKGVDIAFIDSRKGTAVAEFKILDQHLNDGGIIFCHDILNGGKGVEVLQHLEQHAEQYEFRVINTGPHGMIKIRRRRHADASRR